MSIEDLYTAAQIARILAIKVETLYDLRWRANSGCPLFKQGKRLFADKGVFDKWYQSRMVYV